MSTRNLNQTKRSLLKRLEQEIKNAAKNLEFERAAVIRDKIKEVKKKMLEMGVKSS